MDLTEEMAIVDEVSMRYVRYSTHRLTGSIHGQLMRYEPLPGERPFLFLDSWGQLRYARLPDAPSPSPFLTDILRYWMSPPTWLHERPMPHDLRMRIAYFDSRETASLARDVSVFQLAIYDVSWPVYLYAPQLVCPCRRALCPSR